MYSNIGLRNSTEVRSFYVQMSLQCMLPYMYICNHASFRLSTKYALLCSVVCAGYCLTEHNPSWYISILIIHIDIIRGIMYTSIRVESDVIFVRTSRPAP